MIKTQQKILEKVFLTQSTTLFKITSKINISNIIFENLKQLRNRNCK